jgi:hypothetical protein
MNYDKPTYQDLLTKITQLEGQVRFAEEKRKYTIAERIPQCQLCFEPVESPVTFNNINGSKCPASQSNPCCLLCVRNWLDNMKRQRKETFYCLWRCCTMSNKGYITYGELGRTATDVAEPTMYRMMGSEGVTVCRRCHTDCVTVYNLSTHIKTSCALRKISCTICKKIMEAKDLPKHRETCYYKCQYCGDNLPSVSKSETIQHYCKKKPIFNCKFCNMTFCIETLVTNYNNRQYHKCCKLYKNESVPSTGNRNSPSDYYMNNNSNITTSISSIASSFGREDHINTEEM